MSENQIKDISSDEIRLMLTQMSGSQIMLLTARFKVDRHRSDNTSLSRKDLVEKIINQVRSEGRERELINYILRHSSTDSIRLMVTTNKEATQLNDELTNLRQQIIEFQKNAPTSEFLESKIKDILETADQAVVQSGNLRAKLLLPPSSLTDVHLVPAHSLERLEEYRSDESLAFLFIGAFGGAMLGILSNWVTNEAFTITRASIGLLILLGLLTIGCVVWVVNIRRRADKVKARMLEPTSKES